MFCKKCGQEIKMGAKFCVKCGTPVTVQQPQPSEPSVQPQQPLQPHQPVQTQKKNGRKGPIIALICVIVIALAAVVGLVIFYHTLGNEESNDNEIIMEDEPDKEDSDDESEEGIKENGSEADEVVKGTEVVVKETEEQASDTTVTESTEIQQAEVKQHEYRIVVKDVSWTEAYQEAKSVQNGYLVNIDSEEEWNTILQLIQAKQHEKCIFWIGAIRRGESEDYFWVDAEGNSVGDSLNQSSNWLTGEPTYYDSENNMEERYVEMFFYSKENRWVWNDTPDDLISLLPSYSGKIAYIVEIENE